MIALKVRGWDAENNQMLPSIDLSGPISTFDWLGKKDVPQMLFMGLFDKNNQEIYAGDILRHNGVDYLVKYSTNQAQYLLVNTIQPMNWRDLEWLKRIKKYVEVIGNMYQHKHLIP